MRVPSLFRVLIGHIHLGERALVQHRTVFACIVVGNETDHRTYAGVEPETELPVLPGHFAILDGEAGPFGLHGHDGFVAGQCLAALSVINAGGWRHRNGAIVCEAHDLLIVHVDDEKNAWNLAVPGVLSIGRIGAATPADTTALGLFRQINMAGGRDVARNQTQVGDATLFESFDNSRIFFEHVVEAVHFRFGNGRLIFLEFGVRFELRCGNIDHCGVGFAFSEEHGIGLARNRQTRMPGQHFGFWRLLKENTREDGFLGEFTRALENVVDRPIFFWGQSVEWMVDGWLERRGRQLEKKQKGEN